MSQASVAPGGAIAAALPNEPALTLVSAVQPSQGEPTLTTPEVAQRLNRSLAWVKRHAHDLGGRLVDGAYRYPAIAIERRVTTSERITLGTPAAAERERAAGQLAAQVFRAFADCTPLDEIVMTLGVTPEVVRGLFVRWQELRALSRQWLSQGAPTAAEVAPPKFDHEAAVDGSCCEGHTMQRRMTKETASR